MHDVTASTTHPPRPPRRVLADARIWLIVLVAAISLYRFSLVGSGHFYWGDERCFLPAVQLVNDLERGEYRRAIARLYEPIGSVSPSRPGFVLVSILPVVAQRHIGPRIGIQTDTVRSYDIVAVFNALTCTAITACVFVLAHTWMRNTWYALLAATAFSLLGSSNVWIRHMVPYNQSLLFGLAALCLLARGAAAGGCGVRAVAAGLLTGLAHACYPGHYAFVLINGAVAWLGVRNRGPGVALAFCAALATVIAAFELMAQPAGMSYIADSVHFARSVTMGSFAEGYVFAWRVMRDVEGAAGIASLLLFCALVGLIVRHSAADVPRSARVALIAALGAYLFHATLSVVFHRMVFYGRTFLVFIPFIVCGAVMALVQLRRPRIRRFAACGFAAVSVASFATFAVEYSRVVYPADFLQSTMMAQGFAAEYPPNLLWRFDDGTTEANAPWANPQVAMVVDSSPEGQTGYFLNLSHAEARRASPEIIGANLSFMGYIAERDTRFSPGAGYVLAAEAPHPELLPALGFYEGRRPWERRRLAERGYTMRIYRRDDKRMASRGAKPEVRPP